MTIPLIFRNLQIHSINASKKSLIPKYPLNKLKILKYANIAILQQSVRDRKKAQKRQNSEVLKHLAVLSSKVYLSKKFGSVKIGIFRLDRTPTQIMR